MSRRDAETSSLFVFLFNTHLPETAIAIEDREVLGAIECGGSLLRHWQGVTVELSDQI